MSIIIIAEAGINHNGSIELAKCLVEAAADSGVDYIKFQTFKTKNLVTKTAKKAAYQQKNMNDNDNTQYNMLEKLELSEEDHCILLGNCKQRKIKFLSTAFDLESIEFLSKLDLDYWKIPSGEITNYPYLKRIGRENKPVFLSSGMSTIYDVKAAINVLVENGTNKQKITVLHCNTQYPTPMKDVNLLAMQTIAKEMDVRVGYSDHTMGIEIPIAAAALGATVIEKHFTLDRNMEGPDHKASLEPNEMKAMIEAIRNVEKALGTSEKTVSNSERENKNIARKSIVAARNILKGETLNENNLSTKRPGNGISPMEWENIIGKAAIRKFDEDELIEI